MLDNRGITGTVYPFLKMQSDAVLVKKNNCQKLYKFNKYDSKKLYNRGQSVWCIIFFISKEC